jgi:hypothetical protein
MENVTYSTASHFFAECGDLNEAILAARATKQAGRGGNYIWNGMRYRSLTELANAAGVARGTLYSNITKGMDIEEAVCAAEHPREGWRRSTEARREERERAARATDVEKIFFRIMGTHKTESFGLKSIGKNEYAWKGDMLDHRLQVGRHSAVYSATFRATGNEVCRREISNG